MESMATDKMGKGIQVVYACDNNFAMLAGISIASLLENSREDMPLSVYVLCCDVSEENGARIRAVAEKFDRKLELIDATIPIQNLTSQYNIDVRQWSLAAYARLLATDLLPDVDRILYFDCDTLIMDDVEQLWNTELKEASCAAAVEQISFLQKKIVGLTKEESYFNSGVMLIELNKWREKGYASKFAESLRRHNGRLPYADQGCINEVCHGDIATLPAKYNVHTLLYNFSYEDAAIYRGDAGAYSKEEIEEAKKNPSIIHFTSSFLSRRPWVEGGEHPYAGEWERVRAGTPWADAPKRPFHSDVARRLLGTFYRHTPRKVGVRVAALINSYIRPLMNR